MLNKNYIKKLFNLESVIFKDLYFEGDTVRVLVAHPHQVAVCPTCMKCTTQLVEMKPKVYRDIDFGERKCLIEIDHKRFKCLHCFKTFMQPLPFARPGRRYTRRFERQVYEWCKESTVSQTALKFGLCEKTVQDIYTVMAKIRLDELEQLRVTSIGIDEIAKHKGHQDFILIITDLKNKRVIDVLPDRKKETLEAYFKEWPEEKRNLIETVAIDLWVPYRSAAESLLPKASIVADRFHVMQNLNKALDECRREEKKKA